MNLIYSRKELKYPESTWDFSPSEYYPEYPFAKDSIAGEKNYVYDAIRDMFRELELDKAHQNTSGWNPLGEYISPGDTVLVKPNFVLDKNLSKYPEDLDCLVTHPSIIRCILDYTLIALKGAGKIYVADSPVKDCDFNRLMEKHKYNRIFSFMDREGASLKPVLMDLRGPEEERQTEGDTRGVVVNLGEESYFYRFEEKNTQYRVPNYDYRKVEQHHSGRIQEYNINEIALKSNVIINLPKPKTHRKSGYTGALKNFIGINYSKEYLPHHTFGSLGEGGDEFEQKSMMKNMSSLLRQRMDIKRSQGKSTKIRWLLYKLLLRTDRAVNRDKVLEGAWFRNNTLWKTILDLNVIIHYADASGKIKNDRQRKIISLGDMIIAGEGEGPLAPSPKKANTLLFSDSVVEFDSILVKFMGFDYKKLKTLGYALEDKRLCQTEYDEIECMINIKEKTCSVREAEFQCGPFKAAKEWEGYIEN